jgi:hypothetical protein
MRVTAQASIWCSAPDAHPFLALAGVAGGAAASWFLDLPSMFLVREPEKSARAWLRLPCDPLGVDAVVAVGAARRFGIERRRHFAGHPTMASFAGGEEAIVAFVGEAASLSLSARA